MARPKKVVRPTPIRVSLPEDVYAQLALLLYSDLEGKVPHGAWSDFITDAIRHRLRELKKNGTTRTSNRATQSRVGDSTEHGGTETESRGPDSKMGPFIGCIGG